ncbi:MAG: hypothetical protein WCL21_18960, partial [Mariniphaga sp.]
MNKRLKTGTRTFILAMLLVLSGLYGYSARTASLTGNWNSTATWGGATVPTSADDVTINSGITVTINATASCLSMTNNGILTATTFGITVAGAWVNNGTFNSGTSTVTFSGTSAAINSGTGTENFNNVATASGATTLTINSAVTVGGSLTLSNTANTNSITIASSNSITVSGTTSILRPTTSGSSTLNVGAGTLTTGVLTLGGSTSRNTTVTVSTGTVNVSGNFTGAGTFSQFTFSSNGTLKVGGSGTNAIPQNATLWTFTPSTGTVNFNANGAQTVGVTTYNNLIFSGSGVKSMLASTSVTGNLNIRPGGVGTATTSIATGQNLSVNTLSFADADQVAGTWGYSGRTNNNTTYFANTTGYLTVAKGPATKGVLTTQPSGAVNGVALTTQPVVQLQDASSNNVSTAA